MSRASFPFVLVSVYSVTKSAGAAITILRLAQKYGDEVFDLKIKDYVSVTAAHDGWDEVIFRKLHNGYEPIV